MQVKFENMRIFVRTNMKRNFGSFWVLSLMALLAASWLAVPTVAAPKANNVQDTWTLDINYTLPQPIMIRVPGQSVPKLYWYFTYTVINDTGEDQMFTPEIVLYTGTGQITQAGAGINPFVYQKIKKIHNDPFLLDGLSVTGNLLQGADNAKSGIVVFPNFDAKAASFDIFFGGLSGDSAVVKLPSSIEVTTISLDGKVTKTQKNSVILAKTLQLKYQIGTQARDRAEAKVKLEGKGWIMR